MKSPIEILILACLLPTLMLAQEPEAVMVIAHRGAAAYAPENTLVAMRKAIELDADALEIDVRQTKDGQLVLMHDATVDRTTDGSGAIGDMTLDELRALDAGSWFSAEFAGERVPTLGETIELMDSSLTLIIEVKGDSETYPDIERRVVDLITAANIRKQVILKSFDREVLETFRRLASDIPRLFVYTFRIPWLGLIIDDGVSAGSVLTVDSEYLQPHRFFLSKSFVEKAHEAGYKVIAWGVDTESHMKEAIEFGVDGIETDYPDILVHQIGTAKHRNRK
ncbi:MAG: glycerophosphodiester phosphodiesterase [Bacteroidota bacterium]